MGDHATTSHAPGATTKPAAQELNEAVWKNAVQGVSPLVDSRVPGKAADLTAMLPYVDHDRLAVQPLNAASIPIRLVVTDSKGTKAEIRLDEAKRMRVYGLFSADDALPLSEYDRGQNMPEQFEAQSTAQAEKIAATVLARPLGIQISSDDDTGRGDKK